MHVALIGAEFEENLAIRYLWSALQRAGHRVTMIVFNSADQTERAARQLADSDAELAGFSMVFTYRARQFALLASRARELGYSGHIVAGGHFAAFNAEQLLQDVDAFDSVACGEGEPILTALAGELERPRRRGGAALGPVEGLVWRATEGLVRNQPALKPPDLDVLAIPPRKEPLDDYLGLGVTNILSSRGCSHACAFCSIAAWHRLCGGARLRMRAVEQVVDEMAVLYRQGARIFNFHDDNFFPRDSGECMARVTKLKETLEQRGLEGIAFAVKSRPDTVTEELFGLLQSAGLFRIFLGVEAGTATSLEQLGRSQSLSDNERALEIVNRLDIHTCFNLLVLNPDSTLEDLAANVAFLRRNPNNPMNFCRTEIYAGTPLERRLRRQDRLRGDYWGYDYTIADPRAQAAFDVIYPCFEERNYGDLGLHHQAMQLDYEHQLLAHFFGARGELRERIKRYIVAVNENTAEHLEAIIGEMIVDAPGASRQRELIEHFGRQIAADNVALGALGQRLLEEVRRAPHERRSLERPWVRAAAAAGLAATLTMGAATCKDPSHPKEMAPVPTEPRPNDWDSHPMEMAPMPPEEDAGVPLEPVPDQDAGAPDWHSIEMAPQPPPDWHSREMAPQPPPDWHSREMAPQPPPPPPPDYSQISPNGLLPRELTQRALRIVARYVWPPQAVELELWFDGQGQMARIALRGHNLDKTVVQHAGAELSTLSTNDSLVRGRRFVLKWTAAELRAARGPTHSRERAPQPPPPPPTTHPRERAPQPPRPPGPPPPKPRK